MSEPRAILAGAFRAAIAQADPARALRPHLPPPPDGRMVVVGAGKAAAAMAAAVEDAYRPSGVHVEGVVVTRYGHGAPTGAVRVLEAAHPVPDAAGVRASEEILAAVRGAGHDDHVLALISGGGSALLCAPVEGLSLAEKRRLTEALLRSGATITEINTVRRHLSRVKGGRLAALSPPAPMTALVLSDVVGDDLGTIASGVSVADPTTYGDALTVLDRYEIDAPAARRVLVEGAAGDREETPKPGDHRLRHCRSILVATNQTALEAAAAHLRSVGYDTAILSNAIVGEANVVGAVHGAIAEQAWRFSQPLRPPCAFVSGGETTVTVRGQGRGGRNGEVALGFVLSLPRDAPVSALFADTDGIDGSEDNAGAFVTPELLDVIDRRAVRAALARNDSYGLLSDAGHLFVTGPTRTNVNDLRIVLVHAPTTR